MKTHYLRLITLIVLLSLHQISAFAARESIFEPVDDAGHFSYQEDDAFEGQIPTADEFFGIPLGQRFTPHRDVMDYCQLLAEKSPRVALQKYGESAEGRDLVLLMISSAENIENLEAIRQAQMLLSDPSELQRQKGGDLEGVLKDLPAVVWLSYNVHGDESSATEAALATMHQLVDGKGERWDSIRRNTMVIVDPLLNPDGRERYLQWYNSVRAHPADPNPMAREHSPPSPSGRTNHYYFDLNRDWAWQSQPETRQRIVEYLRWQPLVHVDFHEMSPSSTYFFFPPEEPFNANIPEDRISWSETFGKSNAQAFDRFGWKYYTGEQFDLFYPAYGDSWPTLNGAIGMTYEQAGGGRAGLTYRKSNGELLTLVDRLHHQHVAGLATVECASDNREDLQKGFYSFKEQTILAGRNGEVAQYLLPPAKDDHRRMALVDLLSRQGIQLVMTMEEVEAAGLSDHAGSPLDTRTLAAGTIVVSLDQPQGRLAKTLLEREAEVGEAYFYDVSAWSLPLSFGVETLIAKNPIEAMLVPWSPKSDSSGQVDGKGSLAYLHRWVGIPSAKALRQLQDQGQKVDLVTKPIELQGHQYPAGTLVVRVSDEESHEVVRRVAEETGTFFRGTDSSWTEVGPDLGSDQFPTLAHARVAVLGPDSVSSYAYGAVWSFLEQEMGIPFTAISSSSLRRGLDDFDVLVIPSGVGSSTFGEETRDALRSWIRGGGVCIAMGSSAFRVAGKNGLVSRELLDNQQSSPEEDPRPKTRTEIREEGRKEQVPGNIVVLEMDREHPLGYGLPQRIHGFISSTRVFKVQGDGQDVAVLPDKDPVVSGFISEQNQKRLGGGVWLASERSGRGQVVLFAGDPLFRSFWRQSSEVFLNALLLLAR